MYGLLHGIRGPHPFLATLDQSLFPDVSAKDKWRHWIIIAFLFLPTCKLKYEFLNDELGSSGKELGGFNVSNVDL